MSDNSTQFASTLSHYTGHGGTLRPASAHRRRPLLAAFAVLLLLICGSASSLAASDGAAVSVIFLVNDSR